MRKLGKTTPVSIVLLCFGRVNATAYGNPYCHDLISVHNMFAPFSKSVTELQCAHWIVLCCLKGAYNIDYV